MIDKYSYLSTSEETPAVVPLFHTGTEGILEKCAADLLPEVVTYIEQLRPEKDSQYILVNALGAGEYYGPNSWADHFPESGLIHRPSDWRGIPELDKIKSKNWTYGLPTYYNAHVFMHHRNQDPNKAVGFIELATWNNRMKRIELVCRLVRSLCEKFGGLGAWEQLADGGLPDVSQGSRVPYDLCSIHTDWDMYHEAEATFDPKVHPTVAQAVLAFHRKRLAAGKSGIPGLHITRKEYCDDMRTRRNHVLADGRKIFVYNHYPRFFDISMVRVGADKTAKSMLKIAEWSEDPHTYYSFPNNILTAPSDNTDEELVKRAEDKVARVSKKAEITKNIPDALVSKVVPPLSAQEPDLPSGVLRLLARAPVEEALSSASTLGVLFKPHEFDTILGNRPMPSSLGTHNCAPWIMQMLMPFLAERSFARPVIEKRVVIVLMPSVKKQEEKEVKQSSSQNEEGLRKMGAAYSKYREVLMDFLPHVPEGISTHSALLKTSAVGESLVKAAEDVASLYSPLSVGYAQSAYGYLPAPAARSAPSRRVGDPLCPQRPRVRTRLHDDN